MNKIESIYLLILFCTFTFMGCNVNNSESIQQTTENLGPLLPAAQPYAKQYNDPCGSIPAGCGEIEYLDPPILSSPADNWFQEPNVTFSWQKPSNNPSFTRYRLRVYNNNPFNGPEEYIFENLTSESKTVSNLSRNSTWYWEVTAYDPDPHSFHNPVAVTLLQVRQEE